MRKIGVTVLLFLLVFTLFLSSAQANGEVLPEEVLYDYEVETESTGKIIDLNLEKEPITREPINLEPISGGGVEADSIIRSTTYYKENVVKYTEWSGFKRVSDNLNTYYTGSTGQIYSDRQATFGTVLSGGYGSLGFSYNKSITSTIGYMLNVPKNSRVYLGYRVLYNVETGTRVTKIGTAIRSRDKYTIKVPMYGEFKLLNAPY